MVRQKKNVKKNNEQKKKKKKTYKKMQKKNASSKCQTRVSSTQVDAGFTFRRPGTKHVKRHSHSCSVSGIIDFYSYIGIGMGMTPYMGLLASGQIGSTQYQPNSNMGRTLVWDSGCLAVWVSLSNTTTPALTSALPVCI